MRTGVRRCVVIMLSTGSPVCWGQCFSEGWLQPSSTAAPGTLQALPNNVASVVCVRLCGLQPVSVAAPCMPHADAFCLPCTTWG